MCLPRSSRLKNEWCMIKNSKKRASHMNIQQEKGPQSNYIENFLHTSKSCTYLI